MACCVVAVCVVVLFGWFGSVVCRCVVLFVVGACLLRWCGLRAVVCLIVMVCVSYDVMLWLFHVFCVVCCVWWCDVCDCSVVCCCVMPCNVWCCCDLICFELLLIGVAVFVFLC